MLVLLPPSETKRAGGDGALDPTVLHADAELGETRARVREALVQLSSDADTAAKALKLGTKNRGELEHNLRLGTSGVLPAIDRYTGVLYDALDAESLRGAERDWIEARVLVQSALFGLVRAGDRIPAYRLSASSRLPALGSPLKRVWGAAHAGLEWPAGELILDLRSQDYRALAPVPEALFLHVVQRGADGQVRALNHFNKAAKGELVRRLARSGALLRSPEQLVSWARDEGLELHADGAAGEATLVTELGAPAASSRAA
ncbi:YaaA family protein [Leucobacter massiliensis]|uniref:Peroxide stress protein YaaA n=1 Tax=Leucobacter massiliensis TaxID=1686285 RepID=A0A2S9QKL7_9MICO|nr:peroxide stress protein YaaA [Leucobacter massiliensis]PRI10126.1 hypothetical protein B4915_13415 [Leucobacter massiliensis]